MSERGEGLWGLLVRGAAVPPPPPDAAARRWRWEHAALLLGLLVLAGLAGRRPAALGEVAAAARLALAAQAAHGDLAAEAEAWRRLASEGPRSPRFQGAVTARLIGAWREAEEAQRIQTLWHTLHNSASPLLHDPEVALQLGAFLLDHGRPEAAAELLAGGLRQAAESDPEIDRLLRLVLAESYAAVGRHTAAEQLYRGLLDAAPDDPDLLNHLAYHYAQRGVQLEQAEGLIGRALALHERPLARLSLDPGGRRVRHALYLDTLGWVHYKQGRLEEAEAALRRAADLTEPDPQPVILYHLAQVHYDRGSDLAASQLIEQALRLDPGLMPARRLREQLGGGPGGDDQVI